MFEREEYSKYGHGKDDDVVDDLENDSGYGFRGIVVEVRSCYESVYQFYPQGDVEACYGASNQSYIEIVSSLEMIGKEKFGYDDLEAH